MRSYEFRYARRTGTLALVVRLQCANDFHALSTASHFDPDGQYQLEVWADADGDAYPIFVSETTEAELRIQPRVLQIRKAQSVI